MTPPSSIPTPTSPVCGPKQAAILRQTGPLLAPAAGDVITLAYDYLLSRPESAGFSKTPRIWPSAR